MDDWSTYRSEEREQVLSLHQSRAYVARHAESEGLERSAADYGHIQRGSLAGDPGRVNNFETT